MELLGPTDPYESFNEFPTRRYLVGRLAPATDELSPFTPMEDEDNDEEVDSTCDNDETSGDDAKPPLMIGFSPSSIGISFLLENDDMPLRIKVTWGDYYSEKGETERNFHRNPIDAEVTGIRVSKIGKLDSIQLSQHEAPNGITITGVGDPEITIEGVVHDLSGHKAVSIFLVNRRQKIQKKGYEREEKWVFQPRMEISAVDESPIFCAKDSGLQHNPDDDEEASISLLYRHAREFATGHGVATGWIDPDPATNKVSVIYTEFIPEYEVPKLRFDLEGEDKPVLDMKELSQVEVGQEAYERLIPFLNAYDAWLENLHQSTLKPEFINSKQLLDAANRNIEKCRSASSRMHKGLELIRDNPIALKAFKFANHVMWDQRIHSVWAAENRKKGEILGTAEDHDVEKNRMWRPFQMGFILLNLQGMVDEKNPDRSMVDLLWFPTGGGKTEAYLGLAAFTLAFRRLTGNRFGMEAGAGVSVIMRYTLRLLTVQQFQRASALICACEVKRKSDPETWGDEPFRIGLWVGASTTPNEARDSLKALEDIYDGKRPREGSPVQVVTCPRCGKALVTEKGQPENLTYDFDTAALRTKIACVNPDCEFCYRNSDNEGLPVVVVDDEIYRTCPSMIIATVDKFARMPFKGLTQSLFGLRNRYSKTYGHLVEAYGDFVGSRKIKDAQPASRLLPPELIIQDELHLISGPLGSMVGLYETAIDFLTSVQNNGQKVTFPKIIASTATIRRADQQVKSLYNRELSIFPPSGLTARDSFFAKENDIDKEDDTSSGRIYLGVMAPGTSIKTLLTRVYALMLICAQEELEVDPKLADPYGTLIGYFNSLRTLGGTKRLVEHNVRNVELKYLNKIRKFKPRYISAEPDELTSRLDSWKIPGLLKKLDNTFEKREKGSWPIDVLLATNMISVGVDIDRLGLMVVCGQPKSTSEYIQASSRVGRLFPGLIITMYNWLGARDISHYERFKSYHQSFYRYVEANSVTPFSSRAMDRGLSGIFTAMNRLAGPDMAQEKEAVKFDPLDPTTLEIIEAITKRAAGIVGNENAQLAENRLKELSRQWAEHADELLRYSWLSDKIPEGNPKILIKTAGTDDDGKWDVLGSLREVEPTAAFYLADEEDLNDA